MSSPLKVLITGPAPSLSAYFNKLSTLQAKHSFDLILALDLFSSTQDDNLELAQLLAGQINVPAQVYVAVAGALPSKIRAKVASGEEICNNLSVLGKTGILTLASGLRIGTFGGNYDAALFNDDARPSNSAPLHLHLNHHLPLLPHSPPTTSSLPPRPTPPPDILLTHTLPSSLPLLSTKPAPTTTPSNASPELDQIIKLARPKYAFIGGLAQFWEREPFEWSKSEGGGVCRAIGLGEMGNKTKERWFYAFSITPSAAPGPPPANLTPSPFNSIISAAPSTVGGGGPRGMKRAAGSLDTNGDVNEYGVPNYIFGGQGGGAGERKKGKGGAPPDHYTCNICEQKGHWIQDCPEKAERDAKREAERAARGPGAGAPRRPLQPDECWFCLSNPRVTKHLIASIGSETYLTLPKGQLCVTGAEGPTPASPVPGGGHVLIIPIAHYPTLLSIPSESSPPILAEVEAYKEALRKCYDEFGADLVAFEVGRLGGKGGHAHVQVCPLPRSLSPLASSHFIDAGAKGGLTFSDDPAVLSSLLESSKAGTLQDDYWRIDLPDEKVLCAVVEKGKRYDLGFGRTALASLLNTLDRADWKACTQTDAEEKADTQRFKKAFAKWDPSE
ncbi:CwfJ C-terminus 1-domain-containing protein-like protein [Leucosporidium creatinivorum]|uniref:CwfJ C-terminus 1-domain-containing protein-like protein n=1 Tax=Leucosporidium creatinivorum TaxID=106004 RepID=A0A1Y2D4P8_9BASI|nr:CwfJ C-terminus 1-domain-containing protein-like protein [Leucosporidium creatinivorum]